MTTRRRARGLPLAAFAFAISFASIQAIPTSSPGGVITNDLDAPPEVERILRSSCYDCHSDETRLRWFDRIAPASWLVAEDVENGRDHLNFSELGNATTARKRALLYESLNHIELGAMPPRRYTLFHPSAVVTAADLATLNEYLHPEGTTRAATPASPAVASSAANEVKAEDVEARAAPNGLAFLRGYQSWQAITTSERFDSGTLRVILANDIAIRAIETEQISPWPDGAAFAKVLWTAPVGLDGMVRPGTFQQIDFMVKDSKRAASTLGWRWGRWLGAGLVPYGNTPSFALECAGCHEPMRKHDFVFTMPIKRGVGREELFNRDTVLPPEVPPRLLARNIITMVVDPARGTTSVLFGNAVAVAHAHSESLDAYPPGSEIARVTWFQRANPFWYGGRMPGRVKSVELLDVGASDGSAETRYTAFEGSSMQRAELPAAQMDARRGELIGARAAFMPRGKPRTSGD